MGAQVGINNNGRQDKACMGLGNYLTQSYPVQSMIPALAAAAHDETLWCRAESWRRNDRGSLGMVRGMGGCRLQVAGHDLRGACHQHAGLGAVAGPGAGGHLES